VTTSPFGRDLVRKSARALVSARELLDHDFDGAVNRSYYAMFNIARAALLSAGVAERDLPRTHNGVIAAFRQHAVLSGRIDPELAAGLGRTENLRLRADYTGDDIDASTAAGTVARATEFVTTVGRAFGLHESSAATGLDEETPNHDVKVSEPDVGFKRDTGYANPSPFSMEDIRRRARENWLRLRQQHQQGGKASSREEITERAIDDRGHSVDDLEE
jgi:uncharacterized protein (UPF0332 family)